MKIKYGDNATGKSRYARKIASDGGIVLTSRMESWKDGKNFEQFTKEKNDQKMILEYIKNEIFSVSAREELGYVGSNTILKKMMEKNEIFNNAISHFSTFESVLKIDKIINIGIITEQFINIKEMDELSEMIHDYSNEDFYSILGLTKFYSSTNQKIVNGNEEFIKELVVLKEKADFQCGMINIESLKNIVKKGDIKLLNILRNEENPGQEIYDNFTNDFLKNIKLFRGKEISEALDKIRKYSTEGITFDVPKEKIKTLQDDFGVSLLFSNNNKIFTYEGNLSDGEFSMLASEVILSSVPSTKEVVLDDVMETLDDSNSYKLLVSLMEYKNVEILTHSTAIPSLAHKIEEIANIPIEIKGFDGDSTIYSWGKLLSLIRSTDWMNKNDKVIRSLLKIISRYISKNGVIHSFPGNETASTMKSTEQWKHWTLAGMIFHYHPKLEVKILIRYFPWLTVNKKSLNSIQLIDEFINELNIILKSGIKRIFTISLNKMKSFFISIKKELIIEKFIFNDREESHHDALNHFWNDPSETFRLYKICRLRLNKPLRDNTYMHRIDKSPIPLM